MKRVMATMPFGKHRGKPINGLSTTYLRWVLGCDQIERWLESAVRRELTERGERYVPAAEVLDAIEEEMNERLDAIEVDHETAGAIGDAWMMAVEAVRKRHGIGKETELFVPEKGNQGRWSLPTVQ